MGDHNRTERVVVKLSERELKRWEKASEKEPNCSNRSEFIRLAVTRQIDGAIDRDAVKDLDLGAEVDTEEIINAVDIAMSDVTERLESIENRFSELKVDIEKERGKEVSELAQKVYRALPRVAPGEELPDPEKMDHIPEDKMAEQTSTVYAWADEYDVEQRIMRDALKEAQDAFVDVKVQQAREHGYERYYVEEHE